MVRKRGSRSSWGWGGRIGVVMVKEEGERLNEAEEEVELGLIRWVSMVLLLC